MGQAVTKGHFRKEGDEESQVPLVSMDYMFMTDEGREEEEGESGEDRGMESGMPILVIVDHETYMSYRLVCSEKEFTRMLW